MRVARKNGRWEWHAGGTPRMCVAQRGAWRIGLMGNPQLATSLIPSECISGREMLLRALVPALNAGCAAISLNQDTGDLVLAADPYGVFKIYMRGSAETFIAGTRLSDVVADSTPPLDRFAFAYFLNTGYTPSRHTFYTGISKVPPGTVAFFENGSLKQQEYFELIGPANVEADEYLEWFHSRLGALIRRAAEGSSSCHVTLSGGVDSTLVLAHLLAAGVPPEACTAVTAKYRGIDRFPDNEVDVDCAAAVARHYGVRHEVTTYNLLSPELLDHWRCLVTALGSEASLGFAFLKMFDSAVQSGAVAYCGQNADSILSFGGGAAPSLMLRPPFVSSVGTWCKRHYMYGGFHDGRTRIENILLRPLVGSHWRKQTGHRGFPPPREFMLGFVMHADKWPFCAERLSLGGRVAAATGLGEWFTSEYLSRIDAGAFAENPHGVFTWLYLQTFMQGSDNRATMYGSDISGARMSMPFLDLEILKKTARVRGKFPFSWHGKYANVYSARRLAKFPAFVFNRPSGAGSGTVYLSSLVQNAALKEYIHDLLARFEPQRMEGILTPELLKRSYWTNQVAAYEAASRDRMDQTVFPRILWFLTSEEAGSGSRNTAGE
jgi:hypothetical protein